MASKYTKYLDALNDYCSMNAPIGTCFELSQLNMLDAIVYPLTTIMRNIGWKNGATKLVLLPEDEDFVIKIPFTGYWDEDAYSEEISDRHYAADRGEIDDDEVENVSDADFYYAFEGAGLNDDDDEIWDYCRLECAIFEKAVAHGLGQYFAKETLIGLINDYYPVYAQVKVDSNRPKYDEKIWETTSSRCEDLKVECIDPMWVNAFFTLYGEEEYVRLMKFLNNEGIWDFHGGNIGYFCGMPILMDYSGYNN